MYLQHEWWKVTEGIHSPTPQPEDHNRDLDPGFEEDPNIFVELEDGVFYQMSYDGTEMAIIADYPGLLPASHVSDQETPSLKELPHYTSPAALFCAAKGRRPTPQRSPEASPRRAAPAPSKSSKRKANDNTAEHSSKRYGLSLMPPGSHIKL